MRQSWETMTSVSAGHIIHVLTPTQPVGSWRPQRGSNPGPPHQESRALPTELPPPPPPPPGMAVVGENCVQVKCKLIVRSELFYQNISNHLTWTQHSIHESNRIESSLLCSWSGGRTPRLTWHLYVLSHRRLSGEAITSFSAGHTARTPTRLLIM